MQRILTNIKLNSRAIVTLSVIICLFALAFAFTATIPAITNETPVVAEAADTIAIGDAETFRSKVQNNGNSGDVSDNFELTSDITIDVSTGVNISHLKNEFNGNGHTITVTGSNDYKIGSNKDYEVGLIFGRLDPNSVVKNLKVVWEATWNVSAENDATSADYSGAGSTTLYVGGLCSKADNGAQIENVEFTLSSSSIIAGIGIDTGDDHVTQTGGQGAVVGGMIGKSLGAKLKNITFINNGSIWARGHNVSGGSAHKGVTVSLAGPDTRGDRAVAGGIVGETQSGSTQITNLLFEGKGYTGASTTGSTQYAENKPAAFHTINFAGGILGFTYGGSFSITGFVYEFEGSCYVKEASAQGANAGAILGKGTNVSINGFWRNTIGKSNNTQIGLCHHWSKTANATPSIASLGALSSNSISSIAQGLASNNIAFTNLREYNASSNGYYDGDNVSYAKVFVTDIKDGNLSILAQSDDPLAFVSAVGYNKTANGAFTYINCYQNGLSSSVTLEHNEYKIPYTVNEIRVILAKRVKQSLYTICSGDKPYDTFGITFTGAPSATNINLLNNLYWKAEHDSDSSKDTVGDLGRAQITTNSSAGTYTMVLYRKTESGESVPVADGEDLGANQIDAPSTIYQFDSNYARDYKYTISRAELTLKDLSSSFEKEYDGTSDVNVANLIYGTHYSFTLSDGTTPKDTPELDTQNAKGAFYDSTGNSLDHTVGQGKVVKVNGINLVGNYKLSSTSGTTLVLTGCRIKPRTVTIEWGNLSQVYNGALLKPTAVASNLIAGDTVHTTVSIYANADDAWNNVEVTGKTNVKDGTQGDADYYIARVTIATNPNYVIKGINDVDYLEEKFYVTKREISLTWSAFNKTFAYENFEVTCVVTNANSAIATGDDVGLSVDYRMINDDGTEGELVPTIINAGKYVAIASLSNTNYVINGSSVRFEDVRILPISLPVEFYTGTANSVQPLVYQKVSYIGSDAGLKAKASSAATAVGLIDANIKITYDGNVDVVGTYTATASFVESDLNPNDDIIISNYAVSNPNQTVTIVPRPITLAFGATTFEYDGEKHIVSATINSGLCTGDVVQIFPVCYINVPGEEPKVTDAINASSDYFVGYTINNSNYVIADGYTSKSFSINKYAIDKDNTLVKILPISDYTYSGTAITPSITVTFKDASLQQINYSVAYSDNIDAGYATVEVNGLNNFSGTLTTTFKINQAVLSVNFTSSSLTTYNGEYQGVTAEFIGYKKDTDFVDMSISYSGSSTTPINAGSYTATVAMNGNPKNYALTSEIKLKQFNFTIQPKPVSIEFSGYTNLIYNGTDRRYNETTNPDGIRVDFQGSPICTGDDLGLAIAYSGTASIPENAGRYTATASLTGDSRTNYSFSEGTSNSITFNISQYVINVVVDRLTIRHNYDSYVKNASYSIDETTPILEGKDPQISLVYFQAGGVELTSNGGKPLNAGSYQVKPKLNNANYKLYSEEKTPFRIDQAPLRISFINEGEYVYNGQAKSIGYKLDDAYKLKGTDKVSFAISYTNEVGATAEPINVGTYKVSIKLPTGDTTAANYFLENANDQEYTAYSESFKVTPKYLAIEFSHNSQNNVYDYTGNEITVTAKVKGTNGSILGFVNNSGLVLDSNLEYEKVSFSVSLYQGTEINDEFLLAGNKIKNVGTYTATARLDESNQVNQNYVIYEDNQIDYPTTSNIVINPKAIRFSTKDIAFSKIYGDADGELRIILTKDNTYDGLVGEDKLSVVLQRESGENITKNAPGYEYIGFTLYKNVGTDDAEIWEEVIGETNYSLSFGPESDQSRFHINEKIVEFEPRVFEFDYNTEIGDLKHVINLTSTVLGNYAVTVTLSPINSETIKKGTNAGLYDLSLSFTTDNSNVTCVMAPNSNKDKIRIVGKSIEIALNCDLNITYGDPVPKFENALTIVDMDGLKDAGINASNYQNFVRISREVSDDILPYKESGYQITIEFLKDTNGDNIGDVVDENYRAVDSEGNNVNYVLFVEKYDLGLEFSENIFNDEKHKKHGNTPDVIINKSYDGTTEAKFNTLGNTVLTNIPSKFADHRLSVYARYEDANAGEDKKLYVYYEFKIPNYANNYILPGDNGKILYTNVATIEKVQLTVSFADGDYDLVYGEKYSSLSGDSNVEMPKLVYSGLISPETPESIGLTDALSIKYKVGASYIDATSAMDAGSHTLTIVNSKASFTNYIVDTSATKSVVVTPKEIYVSAGETFEKTVDGNWNVELGVENYVINGLIERDANMANALTIDFKARISSLEPGNTTVVMTINGISGSRSFNYVLINEEAYRTITIPAIIKELAIASFDEESYLFTFDNTPKSIAPSIMEGSMQEGVKYIIKYQGRRFDGVDYIEQMSAPTRAGTYTANCYFFHASDENTPTKHRLLASAEIIIDKVTPRLYFKGNVSQTYGSFTDIQAFVLAPGLDKEIEVQYSFENEDGTLPTFPPAGRHTVTAAFDETNDYLDVDGSQSIQIKQKAISIAFDSYKNLVYNGYTRNDDVKVHLNGVVAGDTCEPVKIYNVESVKDAGTYRLIVTPSNPSYMISGSNSIEFTIAKKVLNVSVPSGIVTNAGVAPKIELIYTGFVENESVLDIAVLPTPKITSAKVGVNAVEFNEGFDENYSFNYIVGVYTIVYESENEGKTNITPYVIAGSAVGGISLIFIIGYLVKIGNYKAIARGVAKRKIRKEMINKAIKKK